MMGDEIQDYFKTGLKVAKEAGEIVKADFYGHKKIETKENFADLVTKTDRAVEDLIMLTLREKYPSHKFIGEETVSAGGHCELTDSPTWIIDPIDGTTNFVHGIPHTCISIGLAVDKQIVAGIIHCPILGETYTALKGQGAFCNETKISVSSVQDLKAGVVIIEGGTSREPEVLDTKISNVKSIIKNCHGVRAYGSAAINMCFVARGTHAAYMEHGIHVWDIAAGKLIVEEAGGVVCDPSGDAINLMNRRVLAANSKEVAEQLSKIITNISLESD